MGISAALNLGNASQRTARAARRQESFMNAILASSEMIESFKLRAELVSAQVERVLNKSAAIDFIVRLLLREGVSTEPRCGAAWAAGPMLTSADQRKLSESVPGLTFDVTRDLADAAKFGISQMDWALADTGTVVDCADAIEKRLVSTLPTAHIAIVALDSMVPDLNTVFELVDPAKTSYLSFITGPSRTADIERVLTIGAHGPERLIILLVDELEAAA
jgi:L-lactate dehydrogenase complex protein LldG